MSDAPLQSSDGTIPPSLLGSGSQGTVGHAYNAATEPWRPPLPPRPTNLSLLRKQGSKQSLRGQATTAVSVSGIAPRNIAVRTVSQNPDSPATSPSGQSAANHGAVGSSRSSELASARNDALDGKEPGGGCTLFVDQVGNGDQDFGCWSGRSLPNLAVGSDFDISTELARIPDIEEDGSNEELVHSMWKSKRKHFIILSASGKPIYSRHGSNAVVSSYAGIIQTILSFYQSSGNSLRSFASGQTRFVIQAQGNLLLLAISRLFESESQLSSQLEALYLQILSTLTLPNLRHIFSIKPSTDLQRPLRGTEVLLSSLADGFIRGSPVTLLSALESLKLRKFHREAVSNTLLKSRVDDLLYGLIVAGGRLVSVVRPRKHSLHPGDLMLIFNMLFEAGGVQAGGGESWIPICLPGFNPNGFLYMFVSFLNLADTIHQDTRDENIAKEDAVAIILISANKESFESVRRMKDYLVMELEKNKSLLAIQAAVQSERPSLTEILPGHVLRHFLYKSKNDVQFCMPSFSAFETLSKRRSLFSIYHELHAAVHQKHTSVRAHHITRPTYKTFAWITTDFELYCVGRSDASRNALVQNANKIVRWIHKEEERLFVVGGGVF